jgi:glycosyltransferase involved in cell wall biosynthesis
MADQPRILMASFASYPLEGGAEKQGRLLATTLRARGVEVTYVAARLPGMPAYEVRDGVPFYRVFCGPWKKYLRRLAASTAYQVALAIFLLRVGRHYDIFHCHGAFDVSAAGLVVMARLLGRVSVIKHASLNEYAHLRRALGGRLMEFAVRRADAFVVNSPATYQLFLRQHPAKLEHCFYIPNGIPSVSKPDREFIRRELNLPLASPLIVCVSNFNPQKNQWRAVQAWPYVLTRYPAARLVFIGDGVRLEACRLEARRLGLGKQVLFMGRQTDVYNYLAAADVFLFPSETEGLSNALIEAMASGLPCVVSDIPGNRQLITPEQDGLLFDATDSEALAQTVLRVLTNRPLADSLGIAAQTKIRAHYQMEHIAELYLRLYRHLLYREPVSDLADFRPPASIAPLADLNLNGNSKL